MEERYEVPEVITFGELDFEPAFVPDCVSLFACVSSAFECPGQIA